MERSKRIQVYVSPDEHRAIRVAAAQRDCSMSDYMRDCYDQMSAGRQWLHAYHWLMHNTSPSSPRAAELLLSEASALILDGYESELDYLDDSYRDAYRAFVQAVNKGETPVLVLPV